MQPEYLFIVGLPRRGSKLLEDILRKCSNIDYHSVQETAYIGHFITAGVKDKIKKLGNLSVDKNVKELVDYFYTGTPNKMYWNNLRRNVSREKLFEKLLESDRTEKGIYEVILKIGLDDSISDRTIIGDKTGPHLYHVSTIVDWFPQAKIVHILRDPRAILASQLNKKNKAIGFEETLPLKSNNFLYNLIIMMHVTITWLYAVRLHRQYIKQYPQNYLLLKFEDLISQPEINVRKLCQFLNIEFDNNMLEPGQVASSFAKEREIGATGFDLQTLTRWKLHLKPWMQKWMLMWTGKHLRELGYIDSQTSINQFP